MEFIKKIKDLLLLNQYQISCKSEGELVQDLERRFQNLQS